MKIYLKEYREELGITQKEFARLVGLNERTVNVIETGKTIPKADTLKFNNEQYLYNCDLGMTDESLACKLTKAEIEAVDPRLMQFAVEVE